MGKNQSASNLTNIIKQDGSGNIVFTSGSTTLATISTTGQLSGSTAVKSATTASYADNFTVTGNLTAQTLIVQTITSSVSMITGSTKFGIIDSNTHQFTGSMFISGSSTFSGSVEGSIINSTSNAFRLSGNNALSLVTLGGQSVVKINAAGFWGTQLVGANDQGIVVNNTGNVIVGSSTSKWPSIKGVELNAAEVIFGMASGSTALGYVYHNGTHMYVSNEVIGSADMVFNVNGAARIRITSGGNVGIGTSSPNQQLTLKVVGSSNSLISWQNSAGSATSYIGIPNANGDVMTTSTTADLIFRNESGNMLFGFSNQERLRLTNGGDLYVNTTGNYGTTTVSVRSAWSAGSYGQVQFYTGTGNSTIRSSVPGNSTNGIQILTYWSSNGDKITANFDGFGNVYNYNNTTAWQQTSDIRVKENINTISNALDKVIALNPVTFDYKQEFADKNNWGEDKKLNNIGFIAQEFETVFPKYVHSNEDTIGGIKIEDFKSIDTGHLTPYLVKAIQELNTKLDTANAEIEALKNK